MLDNAIFDAWRVRGALYCYSYLSYLFWAISDFYTCTDRNPVHGLKTDTQGGPAPNWKGGKIASETLNYVACDGREGREDYPDYWDEVCSKSSVPTPRMHGFQLMVFLTLVVQ